MTLNAVDFDDRLHAVYATGRAMRPATLAMWLDLFARHAPAHRPLSVLDLGSGTGRLAPGLAEAFGGPVWGVEPSAGMRAVAASGPLPPGLAFLDGRAEAIPLPDRSCDLVVLFLSFHHVRDRPAAVREIARVLKPGGRVVLRNNFADRMPEIYWHRFFPRALAIEAEMFPRLDDVLEVFAQVDLHSLALETVDEHLTDSLAETAARLKLRAISTFEHMTEVELAEGFARLDEGVAAETGPRPIFGKRNDLLVLGGRE
jgi:ubiquinone/menaquinone biosynthesis C-methylase UbiE